VMSANLDGDHMPNLQTYRIVRPDGSLRWVSAQTFLVLDETTQKTSKVCIADDITHQDQLDQTLRKALDRSREQFTLSRRMSLARKPEVVLQTLMSASELRKSNQAFILFFESQPDGIPRGIETITSWPLEMGTNGHNALGKLSDTSFFEELALADLFHPSKAVIVSQIPKDQRLTTAIRDVLLERQIQTVTTFPMVALGKWLGCLLIFFPQETQFEPIELRDIKVLVDQATITLFNLQLLETEAESRHEAERANEIKTQFLAMISHELRTPLTSILGFTTTLLADDVTWDPDEQHDFVQTIQQEANRLQELIDHLLDLSRLEAGRLPIVLGPCSLHEIIENSLPQLHSLTSKHSFIMQIPINLPPINVDHKRIAQVLVNLVRNASAYSPEGTEITIGVRVWRGYMQINVSDQGPGIPAADNKRVFKAFQQSTNKENGLAKGAGLGLAICKGLVEAHGGRIWIKKKNIPGATISFTIPLVTPRIPVNP
jgi:K+-sensing histidine kinase KdpD